MFTGEVQATRRRVGGNDFSDRECDAIAAKIIIRPAPGGRGSAASFQRVDKGRGDGSVEA